MSHVPLKLQRKIFAGYVAVGLVATAIGIFSYIAFHHVSVGFRHFADSTGRAQLDLVLARDVSEMQRNALVYTYEGNQSAAQQVHDLYRSMSKLIQQNPEQESRYVKRIKQHLDAYMGAFQQLQKQRDLQYELVHHDIRASASNAEAHLRAYIRLIAANRKQPPLLSDERILNTLLLTEKNAMHYFDALDPKYITEAKMDFTTVRKGLQRIKTDTASPVALNHITLAENEVDRYERVFLEAVQRTRGYLYLVNVVMSAEAYEVLYNARQISTQVRQQMQGIEAGMNGMLKQVTGAVAIAIVVSLLLVVLLSLMIGRSITNPIVRLTIAFNALAKGSHDAEIPRYEADDEIGHLTKAAAVFKEKNRQTQELLAQAESLTRELERSNDELEQFVYTVSHDLKSPLVTSMGFIGIIQKLVEQGKLEEAVSKLDRVVSSNERMGQLINDLLELSRVGRIDMDKKEIDLNILLADFYDNHVHLLEEAGFSMHIESGLPVIHANESRMLQLFENLLSNALKYARSPEGAEISIGSMERDDAHLVWFRDNGPGIPKEYHEKIFGLFYRLSAKAEGTGIGLAVAAKVMKFHNGSIWVESEPGKGATFWLRFGKNQGDENG